MIMRTLRSSQHEDAVEKTTEIKVLTVIDADVILHPMYFEHISNDIQSMKDRPENQPIQRQNASHITQHKHAQKGEAFVSCPVVSRVWGYISSLWEFGGVSGVLHGHHHMVYSAYSVPLALAYSAECWDGDVIAEDMLCSKLGCQPPRVNGGTVEDHHAFLKAWFYAVHELQLKPYFLLKNLPQVMLPSKSTSVNSDEGYWSSWRERWDQAMHPHMVRLMGIHVPRQAKRHAQGVAELSYADPSALLAAWDMMSSLPVTCLGPIFLWRLLRVVFKPFMMHIVSTLQAISLLVLTLYWLANHNRIPWCQTPGAENELNELVFVGEIWACRVSAVYGVLVELLAYCNVLLRGNRFECDTETDWSF
eukprot:Skav204274  [mRNA]  locus=scaffold409:94192:105659:+ [translate_table: standard]